MINNFDENAYLNANIDIQEAIKKGDFKDALHHLEIVGVEEIKSGSRAFHKDFEPFSEDLYLEKFPDIQKAIEDNHFLDAFDHFCKFGYLEILSLDRNWSNQQEVEEQDNSNVTKEFKKIILESNLFNEIYYLANNQDIKLSNKIAIEHYCNIGIKEDRKPNNDFDPIWYREYYQDVKDAGMYPFIHYIMYGQKENRFINDKLVDTPIGNIDEYSNKTIHNETKTKKVIALIGIPRSGLSLLMSILGSHTKITPWFLPYSTRKDLGITNFTNLNSIAKQYKEAFSDIDHIEDTIIISESTSDPKNINFIIESFKNLSKNGVDTKIIWLTRNINHCYLSQNEASHKYWGDKSEPLSKESYVNYIDFAKSGYRQIIEYLISQEHTIISYYNMILKTETVIKKLMDFINLELEKNQFNFKNFNSLHIAGDPGFFNFNKIDKNIEVERTNLWKKENNLVNLLDKHSRLFVNEFNKLIEKIKIDKYFNLHEYQNILLNEYFDKKYYLNRYPDVVESKIKPLIHYINYGEKENRNPNSDFDAKFYIDNISCNNFRPFMHYYLLNRYKMDLTKDQDEEKISNLIIIDPEKYIIDSNLMLEAPYFKNPEVSIIIPAYNEQAYTLACIESIIRNTDNVSYEIIVADDKSPNKEAREIDKYMKNITFFSNEKNLGFLLNCNKAVSYSKGKYLHFLNNDTNVQLGWLSSLVDLINPSKKIGMVGSRLVYANGQQQEAGGIVWNDASGWNFGRLANSHKPEFNYVKESDYLTGASMMIWKPLWDVIGGFDTRYVPAYYEDTDLAFESRKHGYKALFQPKSIVIHFEGISNGTDLGSGIKKYQVVNKEKFFTKWKDILQKKHFANAQDIFLARDKSGDKPHVLFIDHYLPHFDQDAGSKATFQYLQILANSNMQVHFIGDNFWHYPDTPYLEALTNMGIEVLYGDWYSKNWEEWLHENGKYLDYVILSRPHISVKYIDKVKALSDAKIIYFGHDLHFLREEREYKLKKDKKYLESSIKWKKVELELIKKSDVSYYFSDVERDIVKQNNTALNVDVVPLYIYDNFKKVNYNAINRKDIMFVGGFAHAPNSDAVLWFVKEIFPIIQSKLGNVHFYIIGSKVPEEILELASDSITITGFISDEELELYYNKSRVVVAPLRFGAGVKGKIIDALYNGLPLVTTSIGAEGIIDAENIMKIANDKEEFAQEVITLYQDNKMLELMSQENINYCKKYFSKVSAKKHMSKIIKEFK